MLQDTFYIWRQEFKQVFKDEGVLIFLIIVPLVYPLLYSWIYNNETVHEVSVVVVDDSHTSLSRQFIRRCDASPDVRVAFYAQDMDEAKSLISRQLVKGAYYIPGDFETNVYRMQQGVISVYCDMSLMLTYKAIFQTAQLVSLEMGAEIRTKLGGHYTSREETITARPLDYADVPIFNPAGGYGSFILPGVLMLILQQTLVLGIGMSAGTARENSRYKQLIPISRPYQGVFRIVFGKSLCYFMIYAIMGVWLVVVVPKLFSFPQLATGWTLLVLMLPYILACIFFGMVMSCLVKYRENVMLLMVFMSVPLLFMSGVSWPQSNIPGLWQGVSWIFPSTWGIKAYVRLNSMGASLSDVAFELNMIWLLMTVYFAIACGVYRYQIYLTRQDALERLHEMKERKKVKRE